MPAATSRPSPDNPLIPLKAAYSAGYRSPATLRRMIKDGTLPARLTDHGYKILQSDLDAYVAPPVQVAPEDLYAALDRYINRALANTPPLPAQAKAQLAAKLNGGPVNV